LEINENEENREEISRGNRFSCQQLEQTINQEFQPKEVSPSTSNKFEVSETNGSKLSKKFLIVPILGLLGGIGLVIHFIKRK